MLRAVIAGGVLGLLAVPGWAVDLGPGEAGALSGTGLAVIPVSVSSPTTHPLVIGGETVAYLTNQVFRNPDNTLNFQYTVFVPSSTPADVDSVFIKSLVTGDFGGFSTEAEYVTANPGVAWPTMARRSAGAGDAVQFDSFLDAVPYLGATYVMRIDTDATAFSAAGGTSVDVLAYLGGASVPVQGTANVTGTYAPVVPEPASLGLLVVGALGLLRRRR